MERFMKTKKLAIFLPLLCIILVACSEAKRPIDYPNTTWHCEAVGITFSVSEDGNIHNASMLDKNGNTLQISLVFSEIEEDKISITDSDGSEVYISGTCSYDKDMFSIFVKDVFNPDLYIPSTKLTFERS